MESSSLRTSLAEEDNHYSPLANVKSTQGDLVSHHTKVQARASRTPQASHEETEQCGTQAVQSIIQNIQSFIGIGSDFYQVYPLSPENYRTLLELVDLQPALHNRAKYYYNSNTQQLAIHMGSHLHNDFVNCLAKTINTSLDEHGVLRRPKSKSTQAIADGPELVNFPGEKEGVFPDWQWGIRDRYPGFVLEVGYSQSGTDLEEKAKRYIYASGGEIKSVLIVDIKCIEPRPPSGISTAEKSSATLWRATFPHEDSVGAVSEQTLEFKRSSIVSNKSNAISSAIRIPLNHFNTKIKAANKEIVISKQALSSLLEDSVVYHLSKSQPPPPNKRQRIPSPPNSVSEEDDASVESTPRKAKKRAKEKDSGYRPQGMIGDIRFVYGTRSQTRAKARGRNRSIHGARRTQ